MSLNEMKLSNLGLLNINRKLIDSRMYNENLITTIGHVKIFEDTASEFSSDSYLYKPNITLSKDNLVISCSLNFSISDAWQLAYLLKGTESSIALKFSNEQARLLINNTVIIQYSYLKLEDNTEIKTRVELTKTACKFTLYVHDFVFEKTVNLNNALNFLNLKELYLGNEPSNPDSYWKGSINLGTFSILENNELVYSPSANRPLTFSKILISDGEFKLENNSKPIANHIYEYELSEITRSNGTVLLTSQLDENSRVLIKEIGLYANTAEGEILFSSISGLSINKGEGVPYDLVVTLNISLSFVNVVGFPDINSFVLNEPEPCSFEDFKTVEDVVVYTFTNLERIIKMNAMDIGYNRAQVFYKLQKEITENEECYFTIENFFKISKRLKRIVEIVFNYEVVDIHGNLVVRENGIAENFSNTNYISGNVLFYNTDNWEISFAFKPEKKETGTLLTMRGPSVIQPLIFQTRHDETNNKMYFYAKLGKDNTTDEFIVNSDLFELEIGVQYFIKFKYVHNEHNEENSYYQLLLSDDGEDYKEAFTKYSPRIILPVRGFSIGVLSEYNELTRDYNTSVPFKGTFYANTFKIISNSEEWAPVIEIVLKDTQLVQYYHIPNFSKSRYVIQDICNPNENNMLVLEDIIETEMDRIDFSNPSGFSICMSTLIGDSKPKIILTKTNLANKPYFLFAFLNKTIYFFLYTKSKLITLSKELNETEIVSYLSEPSLFTVIKTKNKISLYKETEEIASYKGMFGTFKNYRQSSLKNYIQTNTLRDILSSLNLPKDVTLDEYVAEIQKNTGKYVKNILAIQGGISSEDIYYINTLIGS